MDDAIGHLGRGLQAAEGAGAPLYALRCAGHLAWGYWLAGDRAAALAAAERADLLLDRVSTPPGTAFLQGAHAALAVAAVRVANGEADRAEALVSPLVAAAERCGWRETIAAGSRLLGQCCLAAGDAGGAEGHFRRALEVASGSDLPGEEWRAHAALADALLRQRRATEAEEHLGRARGIVDRLAAAIGEDPVRRRFLEAAHAALTDISSHERGGS